jgi:NADH dehydrogenase FAD-containing subunit
VAAFTDKEESLTSDRKTLTVVVVGGGYGGIAVAKALDAEADVVLVEPKDTFEHNIAALRALVDPSWSDRIHFPYDGLLERGRVIRDRAVQVDSNRIVLGSGEELVPDLIVLATGSSYPFPGNSGTEDAREAAARFRDGYEALSGADRVLLVGAGPVGIELAGEIAAVWPTKQVTIVDIVGDLLGGRFKPELRRELHRQLEQHGVKLVLGSPLREPPPTPPGVLGTFTVSTEAGTEITADLWFRCYGVTPQSDYLRGDLATARTQDGFIEVTPTLQLPGHPNVFALGDVSTLTPKMAGRARRQAQLVADNIRALIEGRQMQTHEPSPDVILVTFGPDGGAAQLPGQDEIAGAETAAQFKSRDMMVYRYADMFRIPPPTEQSKKVG